MSVKFDKIPPGQFRIDEPDYKAGPWIDAPGNPNARMSHAYKFIDGRWHHVLEINLIDVTKH
jgi:hypothetical protein